VTGDGKRNGDRGQNGNGIRAPGTPVRTAAANRRRRQRRRRERATVRRLVAIGLVLVVLSVVGGLVAVAVGGVSAFTSSCDLNSLQPVTIGENSFVYAADGSLLGVIPAERNRQAVTIDRMSPWIQRATVAIEDRRFYDHGGLDYEGIARAALKNLESGEIVEGGSTLTQQVVQNLYIGRERSFKRKIKEACLALKLDEAWPKEKILETYLNQVFFGNQAYGVEAAAQTYFSKPAKDLDLLEAALIAGLPQAPSAYEPFNNAREAVARRNDVLRAMLDAGFITEFQYREGIRARLALDPGQIYRRVREPYFFSYVRDELIRAYGAEKVRGGGLEIYTTIDPRLQRAARNGIRAALTEPSDPASAVVSINPRNGAIKAMVSVTPGRTGGQFNLAAQGRRQAGSAFKTFVLVDAVKNGIDPNTTTYLSAPFVWQPDPQSEPWEPKTFDNSYYGPSTITQATIRSDNSVFARLTLDLGPDTVAQTAREMGIRTKLQPVASIGLGSNSVSVLEMASAYATLAAGGVYSEPMAIRKVVLPDGVVDESAGWGRARRKRILSEGAAYVVTQILEQNVLSGTGTRAYFGRPAAGKTGTTDNHTDAWFCGYTPNLSTAVWVGYPNKQVEMTSVHGISVSGGSFPAEIWRLFMESALGGTPALDWAEPNEFPVWQPWKGQYQLEGEYETTTTSTTKTETVETATVPTPADGGLGPVEPLPDAPADTAAEPPPADTAAEPPPADTASEPAPAPTDAVTPR
jgi:penicillin-binding protein 1A